MSSDKAYFRHPHNKESALFGDIRKMETDTYDPFTLHFYMKDRYPFQTSKFPVLIIHFYPVPDNPSYDFFYMDRRGRHTRRIEAKEEVQ